MTNKEALEKLKEILFMTGYKEALDLAIKALEEKIQKENKVNVICFVGGDEVARFENVNNDITPDFVSLKALLGFKEKNNDK